MIDKLLEFFGLARASECQSLREELIKYKSFTASVLNKQDGDVIIGGDDTYVTGLFNGRIIIPPHVKRTSVHNIYYNGDKS